MSRVDSVVVGAGQAGLAAARELGQQGLSYRILEASGQVGGSWREYYDSLTLFSPARYSALPGLPFPGEPDRYPQRDEVVQYLEDYAQAWNIPVETHRRVSTASRIDGGFHLALENGESIETRSVIAASGAFAQPHMPQIEGLERFGGQLLHSSQYRSPEPFAGQRVIVIGAANSAVQIAAELARSSRVTLASRRPVRFVPQRLLGKDFHFWLHWSGLDRTQWLSDQSTPVLDDGRYAAALRNGGLQRRPMFLRIEHDGVVWSDGSREPVDVLLFATGFRPQLPWLADLDVLAGDGRLKQRNGIATSEPGLFFVGFPKQRNFASATLRGVGPDAAYVVARLQRWLRRPAAQRGVLEGLALSERGP